LRVRNTIETHPDDPLGRIDQILLADTLVGERTHFGIGALQPVVISRVPVVGLSRAKLGEIGRSSDGGETVQPCLREGGSRRGRARSRILGLPFYKSRGKMEVSHSCQGSDCREGSKARDPLLTRRPGVRRCPPEQFGRLAVRILVPPLSQPALRVGHVIVIRMRFGSGPGRAEEGEGGDEQGRGEHGCL
jgi:hypothetical protein